MKKTIVYCTLCNAVIGQDDGCEHNRMAGINHGQYQQWPTPGGDSIDVCKSCCGIIENAKIMRVIDYDEKPIMERAGFYWDGTFWHEKGPV